MAAEDAIGLWDFSADIATDRVSDRSANHLHGRTVNAPKRAVTGHNWDGSEMDWRRAPHQYGAIHFHDDDLYDCGRQTDFTYTVPADLSGTITPGTPLSIATTAPGQNAKYTFTATDPSARVRALPR